MSENFIDSFIEIIEKGDNIPEENITPILLKLLEILLEENNVLELSSPILICGDIHGQLYDLFEIFKITKLDTEYKYLFLGDYVDRGRFSVNTFLYLSCLKIKYPNKIYLLRGNHETRCINQIYGLYEEINNIYGHNGLWTFLNDIFDLLPISCLIDDKIFCVHGGISPNIKLIESINLFNRRNEIENYSPLSELLWSDPENVNEWKNNQRGIGFLFGLPQIENFCFNNKINFIIRSHQLVNEGFCWNFLNKICTIWSAPNYMYRFQNNASIFKINFNLEQEIIYFKACPNHLRKIPQEIEIPFNINQEFFI